MKKEKIKNKNGSKPSSEDVAAWFSRRRGGFTLIELLLVIAVVVLIGAFSYPFGLSFFLSQSFDETVEEVTTELRRAQMHAFSQKQSSAFGFRAFNDRFVLFQGDSYAERVTLYDEEFSLRSGVALTGLEEIVFARMTGLPNATGTIVISATGFEKTVTVNASGKIE